MPRVSRVPWAAVLRCACLRVHAKEHGQASTPAQWKPPGPFCIYGRTPRRECLTPGERRVWRFCLGNGTGHHQKRASREGISERGVATRKEEQSVGAEGPCPYSSSYARPSGTRSLGPSPSGITV